MHEGDRRISELESLLVVEVPETVWPAEVALAYSQVERAGDLLAHHQRRQKFHINRIWLERLPRHDALKAVALISKKIVYPLMFKLQISRFVFK